MDIDKFVGSRLRLIREKLLFTAEEVAHLSEIEVSVLQSIERGLFRPTPEILLRISEEMGVSIVSFFED